MVETKSRIMGVSKLGFLFVVLIVDNIQFSRGVVNDTHSLIRFLPDVPTFADIAENCGRTCEEYDVTTEDGYILKVFRMPGNPSKPVLLMHGILDTADTYIIREHDSLALTLAAEDYDVWIGNTRGNRYTRRHEKLDPDEDKAFWNFTFHEMGYYDLPATIDLVLNKTGQTKLRAVGHSEGTTIFYVMGATRPEYNDKIHVTACLAPIVYLHNTKGPLPFVIKLAPELNVIAELVNFNEVIGFTSDGKSLLRMFCNIKEVGYDICVKTLLFSLIGYDSAQLEPDFSNTLFSHYPAGTSRKNLVHFSQVGNSKSFAWYDYGIKDNRAKYSSAKPPLYDLKKVTMDVALYLGVNDYVSTIADVEILRDQLPNVVEYKVIDYPLWNHIDHVNGKYMPEYLFPHILDLFNKYD